MHVATDRHGMIKKVVTTTAKEADINQLDDLTQEERHYVAADSAYMSQEKKRTFRAKGVYPAIIERRVRGQKRLRPKQRKNNRRFAPLRGVVELSFAFIKRWMGYTETRFVGLEKNSQYHYLLAGAYNLKRAPGVR
ncbi:transposase, partial [Hydrogenimonas sp.]